MLPPLLAPGSSDWGVVPGRSIGHVEIGESNEKAVAPFGKPASGDAAMGRFWSTFVGKNGGRIDVHATRSATGDRVPVDLVRVTSARFRLPNGLHSGSPSRLLRNAYPEAKPAGAYRIATGRIAFWDDVRKGLAWEADSRGQTVALIVHPAGRPLGSGAGDYLVEPLSPPEGG